MYLCASTSLLVTGGCRTRLHRRGAILEYSGGSFGIFSLVDRRSFRRNLRAGFCQALKKLQTPLRFHTRDRRCLRLSREAFVRTMPYYI